MKLEPLLRAHEFMKVQRPPELWDPDTEDVRLVPLLGEMIAAGLSGGCPLADLTLSASNVVVNASDPAEGAMIPDVGEYVAITVSGRTTFGPDDRWDPTARSSAGLLLRLRDRLTAAGARFAYIRSVPPTGSFTVFLARQSRQ
jgi:hypothetical protein